MMNRLLLILVIAIAFTSCNTIKVIQNNDPNIDISKSKTYSFYGWFGETDDLIDIDTEAFEKAFVEEFTKRGMTYQKDNGDIIISLMVVVNKESTKNRYNSYYGHGMYGFYQPTWGWGYGQPYGAHGGNFAGVPYKENAYLYGTIVCDVFEKTGKKLAWQGVVSKAINIKAKKNREGQAPIIVNKLLRKFPVAIKK